VEWTFGKMVYVGSEMVSSLDEWLDIFENIPEEHKITNCSDDIVKEIGYNPKVAYFTGF